MNRFMARKIFALLVFMWLAGMATGYLSGHERSETAWLVFTEEAREEAVATKAALLEALLKLEGMPFQCDHCRVATTHESRGDSTVAIIVCDPEAGIELDE